MRRVYTLLCLLALAATAFGQRLRVGEQSSGMKADPRLCQLDEYFKKQGHYGVIHSQNNGIGISHTWQIIFQSGLVLFHEGVNNETLNRVVSKKDSVDAICQQLMPSVIDTIRNVLASVRKDASESYMYEYHKDGKDTIRYTLAFRYDDGTNRETVFFESESGESVIGAEGASTSTFKFNYAPRTSANYYHEYTEPRGVPYEDMKQLDIAAVRTLIEPTLESVKRYKGAKTYPVYWQHDLGCDDHLGPDGNLMAWFWRPGDHAGLTTGTHYFLPAQYEQEGEMLYQQIDSLAHNYVNNHPEQRYNYLYYASNPNLYELHNILCSEALGGQEDFYYLGYYRNDEGLHILSVTTKGELWIPKEWTKIKRWVNEKKTYRKN